METEISTKNTKAEIFEALQRALKREHAHQSALADMERQSAVSRLEDKAAYLQRELDSTGKSLSALQGKLDKAYSEMRDLAAKTVESVGGVKILGNPEKNSG